MSKKNKKRQRARHKLLTPPKFTVGTPVRVKPGTTDAVYSDIPLGGWAGTIHEVDHQARPKLYLIEWNEKTIDQMHPVYRQRCQRDEFDIESMWLEENDLQLDTGDPVIIEQPANLISRSLSKLDQDDRIRAIFGLTSDDPLPEVNGESLSTYHRYLATHLSFPFQAKYNVETGAVAKDDYLVTVLDMLDVDEDRDEEGLLCEATYERQPCHLPLAAIESTINIHNRKLLSDYGYWYCNGPAPDSALTTELESAHGRPKKLLPRLLIACALFGGVIGMLLGALFAAIETARFAIIVGAVVVAAVGCFVGARYGRITGTINQMRHGSFYGGSIGAIIGMVLGALIGALLGGIVGLLIGAIIGTFISNWLLPVGKRKIGVALGAFAGGMVQAFQFDHEKALPGALYGAVIGTVGVVVIILAITGLLVLFGRTRR